MDAAADALVVVAGGGLAPLPPGVAAVHAGTGKGHLTRRTKGQLVDDQDAGLRLQSHWNRSLGIGRGLLHNVPDTDSDQSADIGLQAVKVKVIAVPGNHLSP
jgi:hypothetical protein